MQQGSNASTGTSGLATATMTDEQILGIEPHGTGGTPTSAGAPALQSEGPRQGDLSPKEEPASQAAQPARDQASADADPAWLASLESQPEAAAEARRWQAAAKDAAQLDAAYFSADPDARTGLATQLYTTDPGAFRAMLAAGAQMLSERDPQALAELARQLGAPAPPPDAAPPAPKSVAQAARTESDAAVLAPANNSSAFPAEAYRAFQSTANDDVARRVHDAIDSTLRSTLPEGIADGARRRIGEDIFEEVHASLASDRDLARQVGEVLRDWRFDSSARQQVTSLLAGRARAVLPEVARRVIGEWTSSVLASDRAKSARIDAAASRRDITGGRLPETVPSSALRPRNVDYGRMTDEQILEL